MPRKPLKAAVLLLFAILGSGCASQNAITTLPEDVRMTLLAEQARTAMAENGEGRSENGNGTVDGELGADELSSEERLFRQRQRHPERFGLSKDTALHETADTEGVSADPKTVFAKAMKLRRSAMNEENMTATNVGSKDTQMETIEAELPVNEVWQRALARREKSVESEPPAGYLQSASMPAITDELITTAAVERIDEDIPVPGEGDIYVFPISPNQAISSTGKELFREEAFIQLALRRKGGRLPRHITIGRLQGESHEILKNAHDISKAITTITGGSPSFGYDPSVEKGTVRIEYIPRATAEQAS